MECISAAELFCLIWQDMVRYIMVCYGVVWFGLAWYLSGAYLVSPPLYLTPLYICPPSAPPLHIYIIIKSSTIISIDIPDSNPPIHQFLRLTVGYISVKKSAKKS